MSPRLTFRRAAVFAVVLAIMVGLVAYYALVTHFVFAASARALLRVHFTDLASRPSEAAGIWLHNSRIVLGVGAAVALIGMSRALCSHQLRPSERIPLWLSDGILCMWAAGLCVAAGVLIGAYGTRQLRAFWPYAPVEVAAWALLLSIYLMVRLGRNGWRQTLLGLLEVESLLALAAILEALGGGWL
jgi:hypothetical protein